MLDGIGPVHLLFVLAIALIVIGPGKLPEVGSALGKGIREFRSAVGERPDPSTPTPGSGDALAPASGTESSPNKPV